MRLEVGTFVFWGSANMTTPIRATFLVSMAIIVTAALLDASSKLSWFHSWTETRFGWSISALADVAAIRTLSPAIFTIHSAHNRVAYWWNENTNFYALSCSLNSIIIGEITNEGDVMALHISWLFQQCHVVFIAIYKFWLCSLVYFLLFRYFLFMDALKIPLSYLHFAVDFCNSFVANNYLTFICKIHCIYLYIPVYNF